MKKFALILLIILTSCVQDPVAPIADNAINGDDRAYIVCEGLWHYDNSSLSRYIGDSNKVVNDIYGIMNPGYKLGDLANGAAIFGKYLYIVMTTPAIIEKIDLETGKSVAELCIEPESDPRKISIINEKLAYVTCLRTHSVRAFDPSSMQKLRTNIEVGPAPEGIDFCGDYVFAANSGYGDYLADQPKAGTISVFDCKTNDIVKELFCGPNVIEIKADRKRNRIYAMYYNLPSMPDSLGGIVEYDAQNLKEIRRTRISGRGMNLNSTGDTLVFVSEKGAYIIDLQSRKFNPKLLINNPIPSEKWYSCAVTDDGRLFVGNAKNYMILGDLLVYEFNSNGKLLSKYQVGVNPNTILLY